MAAWGQVWPNLLADLLWVPLAAWWAHSRVRRHAAEVEQLLERHREELHLYLGSRPGKG
jgi:hypothetical protein